MSGKDIERLALAYQRSAAKLGIDIKIHMVDDAQYQARKGAFDYDMTVVRYSSSMSPGSEQIWRWASRSKDAAGTFNFAGTAEPAIDAAIDALLAARNEEDFTDAVRTFDRILISGHYVVPLYHLGEQRIARWERVLRPSNTPIYGPTFSTWWAAKRELEN